MKFDVNKESIKFGKLKEKDVNELMDLLQNLSDKNKKYFHPHKFDIKTLIKNCKSNDHYYIMKLEDRIIGYSFLRLFGYEIPSFGCCIRNGFENKGYGSILTNWTLNKAKELGYKKVILKTYKENVSAQRIYHNNGFKIVGETDDKKQYLMVIKY